jgi:hypothetical protein
MPTIQDVERIIATTLVEELLSHRFTITVNDGRGDVYTGPDKVAILGAMFSTDEVILFCRVATPKGKTEKGWVKLIYGNSGWDVITDSSEHMSMYMRKTEMLADHFAEKDI